MKRFETILLLVLASMLAIAWLVPDAQAYERYNSGCQTSGCHGAFTGGTSPRGTTFPSNNKHEMHRASGAMATNCNLCHRSDDGRNPYIGSSNGTSINTGVGCTGCHNGPGLRAHHGRNGVTVCSGCHTDGTPPAENVKPPYYGTADTRADNSCNLVAQANRNENWSLGDFIGLDNDGDDVFDGSDTNCSAPPAPTLSSIAITGPATVPESTTSAGSYTATATWSNGTTSNVTSLATWTDNSAAASISAGVLNTSAVTADTPITISASYTPAGGVTRSNSVSVTILDAAPTLSSIAITGPATVPESTTSAGSYTATATWSNGTTSNVTSLATWTDNSAAASISAGVLNTSAVTADTPITISASYTPAGGVTRSNSVSVTILDAAPPTGTVSVTPPDGATDVPVNTVVTATIDGSGDIQAAFNGATFSLTVSAAASSPDSSDDPSGIVCVSRGVVQGTFAYNDALTTGTFTPNCTLSNSTTFTGTISSIGTAAAGLTSTDPFTWQFSTIGGSPDSDGDGVPDNLDDFPGNNGKGSPPASRGRGKFDIDTTANAGTSLAEARGISDASVRINQAGKPAGYEFRDGLAAFKVMGVTPGGTVSVRVAFPSGVPAGSKVYKTDSSGFHEFSGAAVSGNTVTMTLTDGGPGDSDGQANGVIADPVGVAVPSGSGTGSIDLSTGGASGGCAVAGTARSGGSGAGGLLVLAAIAYAFRRRRSLRNRR